MPGSEAVLATPVNYSQGRLGGGSVRAQLVRPDYLAPARVVAPHDRVELVAGDARGLEADFAEAARHRGQREHPADVGGEPVEQGPGRAARRENAVPPGNPESGEERIE